MTTQDEAAALTARIRAWLARDPDPGTRDELLALEQADDQDELQQRFSGRLQFGTAGLRGVVGAGPNRMNRLVVRETSAGLAAYLADQIPDSRARGVVVTYDARPDSARFAEDAAGVLLGAGFKVYLTSDPQPTPLGAFGVLRFRAAAGVVITASHNPPEYNGFKVYWENGAQIIPPHDGGIAACIDAASMADIPWGDIEDGRASGQLEVLGREFVAAYCARVVDACPAHEDAETARLDVTYTALHGVGADIATTLLETSDVCDVASVPSQHEPDGSFPTVAFPNPEEPGAMDAVIALARERGSALACANDPDADRLAVAVRDEAGDYVSLTGDQIGVLLGDYCLRQRLDFTPIVCASIVSSRMLGRIAEDRGARFIETLTGFKWLANAALRQEDDAHRFLYAYEEALGYAFGQIVRDKDGLSALLAFARMAAELAADGQTVLDRLESLYRRYGLYVTGQRSLALRPGGGSVTDRLRAAPPVGIAGQSVRSTKDLRAGTHRFSSGGVEDLDFHPSDVLIYYLADESRVIVRPSGTEPKMKCYYEVVGRIGAGETYADALHSTSSRLERLVQAHQESIAG